MEPRLAVSPKNLLQMKNYSPHLRSTEFMPTFQQDF